jgi:hypothetical protein
MRNVIVEFVEQVGIDGDADTAELTHAVSD